MYELREQEEIPYNYLDDLCTYDIDYLGQCASTHDCTGLIPAGMVTQDELLAYKDVYSFPTAVAVDQKGKAQLDADASQAK